MKLKDQAIQIEVLDNANDLLKQKNNDLSDELEEKVKEIGDFEVLHLTKDSHSSLGDELSQVQLFECDKCKAGFMNEAELKVHVSTSHGQSATNLKSELLERISLLEKEISQQQINLSTSTLTLKKNETEAKKTCNCRLSDRKRFCRINHYRYTYIRSKSDEIYSKVVEKPDNSIQVVSSVFGAIRKKFTCKACDKEFQKQGHLKKHNKFE